MTHHVYYIETNWLTADVRAWLAARTVYLGFMFI